LAGNESRTQRKLEKKKRKDEERRRRAAEEQRKDGGRLLDRFSINYPTPEMLITGGPIAMATWRVPQALEMALQKAGRPVPPPIHGGLLIDTGATRTCIADDAAKDLGLTPIGLRTTFGASGPGQLAVYQALLLLSITDPITGDQVTVGSEMQATAIVQLNHAGHNVERNGVPLRIVGLLGRDFLRHTKLTYDGAAGTVEVQLYPNTMRRPPSVADARKG
jgi:hypothetical protein